MADFWNERLKQHVHAHWQHIWLRLSEFARTLTKLSFPVGSFDYVVSTLILGFGAIHLLLCNPTHDFLNDDVFFVDSGHMLLSKGFYGINGCRETNMPPGLSVVVGFLNSMMGWDHRAIVRCQIIVATLGIVASYKLLTREIPRIIAGAACLVVIASPVYFASVSRTVTSCWFYFLTTTTVLLVAKELERANTRRYGLYWGSLLTALTVIALMFHSAAIALLGATVISIFISCIHERGIAFARIRQYGCVVIIATIAQVGWMSTKEKDASAGISASEWPIEGFPRSYISQLKVRNGNYPEMGLVTPREIPARILKNAVSQAGLISRALLHRWTNTNWMSAFIAGPILLILVGWYNSVFPSGGKLQDWYFACYEVIFLLWPWEFETRFFFPVMLIACLYLWRGGQACLHSATVTPRRFGFVCIPLTIFLAICTWCWICALGVFGKLPPAGIQGFVSFLVWSSLAVLAVVFLVYRRSWLRAITVFHWWDGVSYWSWNGLRRQWVGRCAAIAIIVLFLCDGGAMQIARGRTVVEVEDGAKTSSPDVDAGQWIKMHSDPGVVVMARHVPTVFHYSNRKLIWFPPSSNPDLLKEGILRHNVNIVVVVHRQDSYYRPPDDECFAVLETAFPNAFNVAYQAPEFSIYQVATNELLAPREQRADAQ